MGGFRSSSSEVCDVEVSTEARDHGIPVPAPQKRQQYNSAKDATPKERHGKSTEEVLASIRQCLAANPDKLVCKRNKVTEKEFEQVVSKYTRLSREGKLREVPRDESRIHAEAIFAEIEEVRGKLGLAKNKLGVSHLDRT